MENLENKVTFSGAAAKLYALGKMDGKERATKLLEKNPEHIDFLNPIGVEQYLKGYTDGVEEAIQEHITKKVEQGKTR